MIEAVVDVHVDTVDTTEDATTVDTERNLIFDSCSAGKN